MKGLAVLLTLLFGLGTGYLLGPRLVERRIENQPFDLGDVFNDGVRAGVLGSGVGAGVGWVLGAAAERRRRAQDLIRFLEIQTGRGDLTDDQRAALAYVAQDLRQTFSK
jgi:hypothetical protein